ncbi:MAG: exosortase/archaeosortase family protein [Oligoflexia bacterium]|nr:exosortase/archaeosortase family protein [Oligoflexia bacterium]
MNTSATVTAIYTLALWPVWRWYGERLVDGSDEPWGLLALGCTAIILIRKKFVRSSSSGQSMLFVSALQLFCYGVLYPLLPPLLRAALGISVFVPLFWGKIRGDLAVTGLLFLSLPIISSMEFFLGFPLRYMLTQISCLVLHRICGLDVIAQGTLIAYGGKVIAVDAPCSGVHMLWCGIFLAMLGCAMAELKRIEVLRVLRFALQAVLLANLCRAVALFFKESGLLALPAWTHTGIGLAFFALASFAIVWRLQEAAHAN